MHRLVLVVAVLFGCVGIVRGATISVGNHILLPNSPNQVVYVFATGGDLIQGVNLRVQIGSAGNGIRTPVFQYGAVPLPSTVVGPGNAYGFRVPPLIFQPNNVGMSNLTQDPSLLQLSTSVAGLPNTPGGYVAANGLLAVLVIDTTGVNYYSQPLPVWPSILSATAAGSTDWAGSARPEDQGGGPVPAPLIFDGSISFGLVPEPSSLLLCVVALAVLAILRRSREKSPV